MVAEYIAKRGKVYNFSKNSLPIVFLIYIHKGNVLWEVSYEEQTYLLNEVKSISKGKLPVEKRSFLKNERLFLSAREKIINKFKSKVFAIKNSYKTLTPEAQPEPARIC